MITPKPRRPLSIQERDDGGLRLRKKRDIRSKPSTADNRQRRIALFAPPVRDLSCEKLAVEERTQTWRHHNPRQRALRSLAAALPPSTTEQSVDSRAFLHNGFRYHLIRTVEKPRLSRRGDKRQGQHSCRRQQDEPPPQSEKNGHPSPYRLLRDCVPTKIEEGHSRQVPVEQTPQAVNVLLPQRRQGNRDAKRQQSHRQQKGASVACRTNLLVGGLRLFAPRHKDGETQQNREHIDDLPVGESQRKVQRRHERCRQIL